MKNKEIIEGSPQFVPVQTWYNLMSDLEQGFLEHMENENAMGMLTMYRYMLSKLRPYIRQYMTKQDKEIFKTDYIDELRSGLKDGNNDYISKQNSSTMNEINEEIMLKIDRLNELVAKSELYLTLKKTDKKPSALAGDDW